MVWRQGLLEFHRIRWRFRLYGAYWANRRAATQPLIVLATGRVGSDLLTSYLHSLPDVSMRGEVLNSRSPQGLAMRPRTRRAVLRHIRVCIAALSTPIGGVKITLDQLAHHGLVGSDLLALVPQPKLLVIYRRSLAQQYVSWQIAKSTGLWRSAQAVTSKSPNARIHVDPVQFAEFCSRIRRAYTNVLADSQVRARSAIVAYEDLCRDPAQLFRTVVCPHLNVPYHDIQSDYVALNPTPLADKVENFNEVADVLNDAHMTIPTDSGEPRRYV